MHASQIKLRIDEILHYLHPFMGFVNCHMVNYLKDNLWDSFVPPSIRSNIKNDADIKNAIEFFWTGTCNSRLEDLRSFVEHSKKFRLENLNDIIAPGAELRKILDKRKENALSIKEFLSEKKRHEVEVTAELISNLINCSEKDKVGIVVDAGDGKGYLSSRLALQYQLNVLGIDANEINTAGAQKRSNKLQRAWNGLTERAELINNGITPPRRGKKDRRKSQEIQSSSSEKLTNYKTISRFITPELDFTKLINEHFENQQENANILLSGLHTCGNLATTCLKVFTAQENIKFLCNVGCCYHLINEEFSTDNFFTNQEILAKNPDYGFPMSKYLKEQKIKLGRNARMLASQSIHRTVDKKELSNQPLVYRALLEVLIAEHSPESMDKVQVGKIKKISSFKDYLEKCDDKLHIGLKDLDNSIIVDLIKRFEWKSNLLDLFYLIRMTFAPVLETLILLDRLLYLYENGFQKSFLMQLFDPIVSPRCYGIISFR